MKYALVEGQRQLAQPKLSGTCIGCGNAMISKCGEVKIWHWAHLRECKCDPWWENETEWHRNWKGLFPDEWQEIPHLADDGKTHIADVKTNEGWVLEFQHSYLNPEERRSRDTFYPKLIWVVDGVRRKKDQSQFINAVNNGIKVHPVAVRLRGFLEEYALLREWAGCRAPVLFDFAEESTLWFLLPKNSEGIAYVVKFDRNYFIQLHRDGVAKDLNFWFIELNSLLSNFTKRPNPNIRTRTAPPTRLNRPRRRF